LRLKSEAWAAIIAGGAQRKLKNGVGAASDRKGERGFGGELKKPYFCLKFIQINADN
jgi:hypothetical protein